MSNYKPTIGLEIHAELKTKTKMFCNSKNDPDEKRPNVNVCPVCLAHPGTLPVINRKAVKHVLKMGIAVGGTLADFTEFDRKNYFYPDLPKGYQISQYKHPLVTGGNLRGVNITRIHLEEDSARSTHTGNGYSLVDFNRSGVPLMELVTDPVLGDAQQAVQFAKELQLLIRYLGVGGANMEKGEMRVEANISVSDTDVFGTKVEIKNLNSFRAVERAIMYEIDRQVSLLEKEEKVVQETRGWDENKQVTFSQRIKEDSHDYRYFPDPDLPKLKLSEIPEFSKKVLEKELPELPEEKRKKFKKKFGIKNEDIEIYVSDLKLADFFERVARELKYDKGLMQLASNYFISDILGLMDQDRHIKIGPSGFSELIRMVDEGIFSSRSAKGTLALIYKYNEKTDDAQDIRDFTRKYEDKIPKQQSGEDALKKIVKKIIEENPKVVKDYKEGKEASLQYLIGQGMKATKGAANPKKLKKLFVDAI